ncbi:MAG: hypothetical protein JW937_00400 [Candidatus Omnitrophica bacterium]|nr:hypothetical protein [Candidatus Omnitrophota bacterium]
MNAALFRQSLLPRLAFALYGAISLILQLAFVQELLIVFSGHELFLGFLLASWMGWVGAGAYWARNQHAQALPYLLIQLLPLLLCNLLLIRLSKLLFGFGMLIGLFPTFLLTAALLAPTGLALGACFTCGCAVAHRRSGLSAGHAYAWEAAGAVAGGLLHTGLIAGRLSADILITLCAAAALAAALPLLTRPRSRIAVALLTAALTLAWFGASIPQRSRALQFRGYNFVEEQVSRYGHLALTRMGSLNILFENGVLSAHFPDPVAYEELAHWPLLLNEHPGKVLVLGGASTGLLAEILKHPVAEVDWVEIDPAPLQLIRKHLSGPDRMALEDLRVHRHTQDSRTWLMQSSKQYDVILLSVPEPINAQINRLYTVEAFEAARARLRPGGILAFQIRSSDNYLSPATTYSNACLLQTLRAAIDHVELVAGNPLLLLASPDPIRLDADLLGRRVDQRRLSNSAVVPSYFPYKLDPQRRQALLSGLENARAVRLNRDLFPVCYAYTWRAWLSKFVSPAYFLGFAALLFGLLWALRLFWQGRKVIREQHPVCVLFVLGAAGILYETVLILAFQALHGYVYWQLGALFAAFMLGLSAGAQWALRIHGPASEPEMLKRLRRLLLWAGVWGLTLGSSLPFLKELSVWPLALFSALVFTSALWPGAGFALAARALHNTRASQVSGTLYAADLWGAALGAVLTSAMLVPVFGLQVTLVIGALAPLLMSFPRKQLSSRTQ